MSGSRLSTTTTWRAALCGVLLFVAVDVVVFRSWLYAWIAKPDSSVGFLARRLVLEPVMRPPATQPSILLLGDSRVMEGCSPELLQELLGGPPLCVRDAAIPSTPVRLWPFVIDELEPPRGGFTVVVAGLAEYDDDHWADRAQADLQDLAFLGPLLSFASMPELLADIPGRSARRDVWLTAFCKTYAWRRDLRDLFASPLQRYREVRRNLGRMRWGGPHQGVDRDLAGVHRDGDRIVGLPPGSDGVEAQLRQLVWPSVGDESAYRCLWLGRLADRTAAMGAELVIVRMPSQVLPRASPRVPETRVLDELRQRPHVHVLEFDVFTELERPEFFFDALHLNRKGRLRFTQLLADALRRELPAQLGR